LFSELDLPEVLHTSILSSLDCMTLTIISRY
jgi:hypothetical protein